MAEMSYKECLVRLADPERNVIVDVEGLPILIKKIPDVDESGVADPRLKAHMAWQKAHPKVIENPDPSEYRGIPYGAIRQSMGAENVDVTTTPIMTCEIDLPTRSGSVKTRIYTPEAEAEGMRPCMVYFHGGGFVGGTIDVVENSCKRLAEAADAVVLNVDYRLAPETPFPGGVEDCYDAVIYACEHAAELGVDPQRVCVAGDSAGGNLAAVCALMDRDLGAKRIAYAALIYPTVLRVVKGYEHIVPWSLEMYDIQGDHALLAEAAEAIGKGDEVMGMLYTHFNMDQQFIPYVSPYMAEDLTGMCKPTIINAEYDFLRPQGEAYGRRLMAASCDVRMIRYRGLGHAYVDMCGIFPQDEDTFLEIAHDMRSL